MLSSYLDDESASAREMCPEVISCRPVFKTGAVV